jgi:hypothetical protein
LALPYRFSNRIWPHPCHWSDVSPGISAWLLSKEHHEEGLKVIAALGGVDSDSDDARLQKIIILDSIVASGAGSKTPFKTVLTGGKTQHFRRMFLGAGSQVMQQIEGCNAVIYYFPMLFQASIGTTHKLALLLGGVNMIVYSIFATVSWFIIERAGRRKLFLIGKPSSPPLPSSYSTFFLQ